MMLSKLIALGTTSLLGLAIGVAMPPPADEPPPPPEPKKKKDAEGPGGELTRAYNLLRRLRADGRPAGRPEDRLKDWTDRAAKLYREAVAADAKGDHRKAHEYGVAAHDLARAVDHARNAALAGPDDDLPAPPEADNESDRTRRDLAHAHERVVGLGEDDDAPEAKFYFAAAKDLYNAARRDAEAGRAERAGELARAAEALTHVPEHLAHADRDASGPDEKPEPRERKEKKEKKAKREKPEPKEKPEPREKKDRPEHAPPIPPPID